MRIAFASSLLLSVLIASLSGTNNGSGLITVVDARKPSRPSSAAAAGRPSTRRSSGSSGGSRGPSSTSRRRQYEEDDDDDEDEFGFPDEEEEDDVYEDEDELDEDDIYDDEEEEDFFPSSRQQRGGPPPKRRGAPPPPQPKKRGGSSKRPAPRRYVDEYDDDEDYDDYAPRRGGSSGKSRYASSRGSRGPAPRGSSRGSSRGRPSSRGGRRGSSSDNVVPYVGRASQAASSTFTRGLSAIREHIPDAATVRDAASSSLSAVKDKSSKLSNNIYREIKGLTSSELEQVMLKATRPDDQPVKGKHVERLVGVTYQISGRYDIYDAVLRKLWNKMAEKDWRTTVKALYILHRFSSDGGPDHQASLKARLRELRRTRDPKRKEKYFNSKQLLEGDASPDNQKFRAFMARYAHYVLLRAQCFGGMFTEIADSPSSSKKSAPSKAQKPITSTSLRSEHLEASQMLLKAGCACMLKDGEECENTALAVERVASDLIGLNTAVAVALNRALRGRESKGADPVLIKRWCEFYSEELLPQTKSMVKKTSSKLDAYGLFLPSRMGASVSPELLKKGLQGAEEEETKETASKGEEQDAVKEEAAAKPAAKEATKPEPEEEEAEEEEEMGDEEEEVEEETIAQEEEDQEEDEYDEYDYDIEEYYDDEEA